jgi:hypothetical protein
VTQAELQTMDRLVRVTRAHLVSRGTEGDEPIRQDAAVCQDLLIFGIDVDEYVDRLAAEFGPVVNQVPWLTYTDQTASFRGFGCLAFPLWLGWRLVRWPFARGSIIALPNPKHHPHRLTLEHLAAVIDKGAWFDPEEQN